MTDFLILATVIGLLLAAAAADARYCARRDLRRRGDNT